MKETDESIDMLNEIYQAATMGVQGSELLINKTEDSRMSDKLHEYSSRYNEVKKEAAELLAEQGEVPRDASEMKKASLWMGVEMNTLLDKSSSHIAEMLIEGSTKGIIQSIKHKNNHKQVDMHCYALENKLLSLQQEQIDDMKKFLL
ncbi:hypothetical protein [Amphibacillus sediminis]|uniref:hypothetical protein n=1 Tax=Amphibacillus sediminis TaxID=360185 RepID=UPI00082F8717|nr:hypothetical protein [Amphibacillus sediminis]